MKKNFSKLLIIFSAVCAVVSGILFIALGISAIFLMDEILRALIFTAGIFLLLLGAFLLSSMLFILITAKK